MDLVPLDMSQKSGNRWQAKAALACRIAYM